MAELDLDAIRRRVDRLAALADQDATGLRDSAYAMAVAVAATLSADDVPALLAEVERLQTKLEDYRLRLVAAEADLLDVRGILSPNGEPERTPVPLVPTIAPAVQWLADEVERLRDAVARIRELHVPRGPFCDGCDLRDGVELKNPDCSHQPRWCRTCWRNEDERESWPCPTARAAEPTEET